MKNKIAIIKDGYDILRIIQGSKDEDNCDFKICLMNSNYEIKYMKLFSNYKNLEFDKNDDWELTYHKSTISKPTKIHLKSKTEKDKYITLPLTELLEPNFNTEIPIPLFKVIVPNGCKLINKYNENGAKKDHRIIDMTGNNIAEIYLTKNGFMGSNFYEKWANISFSLLGNAMEYYATNEQKYIGKNILDTFKNPKNTEDGHKIYNVGVSTNVTDDIGIFVNTINDPELKENDNYSINFIENKIFLGLLGGSTKKYDLEEKPFMIYTEDLKNEKNFSEEESKRWKYIFEKEIKKVDREIKKNQKKW